MERYEELRRDFEAAGARLAGVAVDPIDVSQELATKLGLGFPILADPEGEMVRAYGVWQADRKIALPAIFVIAPDGTVRWRRISASVTERPEENDILDVVKRVARSR